MAASRSVRNSLVGILNRAAPQSKQTEIVGKTRTPGLSRLSEPEKWIIISVGNSASFCEEHTAQAISSSQPCARRLLPAMLTAKRSWSLELQISDRFGVIVADIPKLDAEPIQIPLVGVP